MSQRLPANPTDLVIPELRAPAAVADLDRRIEDLERRLVNQNHAVRLTRATDQSIASGSTVAVSYSSALYDPFVLWSSGASTDVVIKEAGLYLMTVAVAFASNATGNRGAYVSHNGTHAAVDLRPAVNGLETRITVTGSAVAAVGDVLTSSVVQTSGGALNLVAVSGYSPRFTVVRIG